MLNEVVGYINGSVENILLLLAEMVLSVFGRAK